MEISDYISIAALLVASLSLLFSWRKFQRYDKTIKEHEAYKIEQEKASFSIAELEVRALPYLGKGSHTIRISNKGKCRAENIRMGKNDFTEENGVIVSSFKTVPGIEPLDKYDFVLYCSEGVKQNFLKTLLRDDNKQINNKKEFYVNL